MKRLYIWKDLAGVTSSYHDGGGLIVQAESLAEAQRLWNDYRKDNGGNLETLPPPDEIVVIAGVGLKSVVTIFPDSGCC